MSKLKDLTGQTFGYLYVVKRMPNYRQENGRTRTRWLTICQRCGKEYIADGSHMLHGDIVSCGCLKNDKTAERMHATKGTEKKNSRTKNLAGTVVNGIQIIEKAKSMNGKVAWKCKCPYCESEFAARANHLLRGLIQSCGCIVSFAEKRIREIFAENNIRYESQYTFNDLRNPKTNAVLRFDFALLDEQNELIALLEYQGEQHDRNYENDNFGKVQREISDGMKKSYCLSHNIQLFEIWYYQNLQEEVDNILRTVLHVNPVPSKQSAV